MSRSLEAPLARRRIGARWWIRGNTRADCVCAAMILMLVTVACQPAATPASLDSDDVVTIERADRIINTELSPDEIALVVNAHGALVETCMQELGWEFEVGFAMPESSSGSASPMSQWEQWTFADVASAESVGYGLEAYLEEHAKFVAQWEGEADSYIPDQSAMNPNDSARFEVDYFGTEDERVEIVERDGSRSGGPGGGCLGEASRALYGDIEQEMWLQDARGTAQSSIWVTTLEDEAVRSALNRWRDCVREQGFELEDPHHAYDVAMAAAQAADHDQEHNIATTDAACKAETGLALAVNAAFLDATNALLPELEEDLVALQQFESETLSRAKDILRVGED